MMEYGLAYYDNMLRQYSQTAEGICLIRWRFVSQIQPRTVLDYGSGVGWFRAFAPPKVECDTYDIMPVPQTGIIRKKYDLITFWDSLEHLPHHEYVRLFEMTDAVALTIPIKPEGEPLETWKHWKPHEHVWLPDEEELTETFAAFGFRLKDHNRNECPPRVDIHSFLFVRGK